MLGSDGPGGFAHPVIDRGAANVADDLGSYIAKQNRLVAWPTVGEVALVERPRVTRPKIGEDSRAA